MLTTQLLITEINYIFTQKTDIILSDNISQCKCSVCVCVCVCVCEMGICVLVHTALFMRGVDGVRDL